MMQWAWQQPPRIERETIAGPDGNPQHLDWLLPVFDPDGEEEEEEPPPPPPVSPTWSAGLPMRSSTFSL